MSKVMGWDTCGSTVMAEMAMKRDDMKGLRRDLRQLARDVGRADVEELWLTWRRLPVSDRIVVELDSHFVASVLLAMGAGSATSRRRRR